MTSWNICGRSPVNGLLYCFDFEARCLHLVLRLHLPGEAVMFRKLLLFIALLLVFDVSAATAQRRGGGQQPPPQYGVQEHKAELNVFGGYRWTFSRRINLGIAGTGDIDIKDSGFWAAEIDINVHPFAQLLLLYDNQSSELTFKRGAVKESLTKMNVHYLQIGAVKGMRKGDVLPFGSVSLGATYYTYTDSTIEIDGDVYPIDSQWRFSLILGLGVKYYASEKIGIRAQARLPYTFLSTGLGIGIGTGGAGVTFGGNGIAQIDLSGGLFVMF